MTPTYNPFAGNQELLRAWESSLMRTFASNAWLQAVDDLPTHIRPGDCVPNPPFYPLPVPTAGGTLHHVVTTGVVVIGRIAESTVFPQTQLQRYAFGMRLRCAYRCAT